MRFERAIEAMREDIIKSTQELLRIKSIESEPAPGAPLGKGIGECLDKALEMCENMGFKTKNLDGYAAHAEYGEGEDIVGILVHMDVVPEGTGWSHEPYGAEIADGRIYGRGAIDDKGPAVAAMYALKAVMDSGEKFNKRVRIIFGTDEEGGQWRCMKHYFKHEPMPLCGFSPDGDFPIINSEMGIIIFKLEKVFSSAEACICEGLRIKSIKGGNRANMVPDYCECELEMKKDFSDRITKTIAYMNEKLSSKLEYEIKGDNCTIKSFGKSAHGSTPEKGINAISQILVFLCKLPLYTSEQSDFINFLESHIGMEVDGHSFGLDMRDEISGKLVFNLGIMDMNEEKGSVIVNIRYPVTNNQNEIYDIIKNKIGGSGIHFEELSHQGPLYVPADNFLVKKLQKVYEEVTGTTAELISIGGGTYARAIQNGVAFGPLFPGRPSVEHQKDEYIEIEDLIQSTKIFAEAIGELVK